MLEHVTVQWTVDYFKDQKVTEQVGNQTNGIKAKNTNFLTFCGNLKWGKDAQFLVDGKWLLNNRFCSNEVSLFSTHRKLEM